MVDFGYPEINALNDIYVEYKVETKTDRSQLLAGKEYYPLVNLKMDGQHFQVFVDDEYDDLRKNYPLLNLCLVLRELEGYEFADNYEIWCQERSIDSSIPQVKENYEHMGKVYTDLEKIMGKVDSKISDWDFEMNAAAAQKLRRDP